MSELWSEWYDKSKEKRKMKRHWIASELEDGNRRCLGDFIDRRNYFEMIESKKNKTVAFHRTDVRALFRILREEEGEEENQMVWSTERSVKSINTHLNLIDWEVFNQANGVSNGSVRDHGADRSRRIWCGDSR